MVIYPVLDLLAGQAVRGVAGRREEYQPVQSLGIIGSRPIDVARGLASRYGFRSFYVADLDGILHDRPNWDFYAELIAEGFTGLIDLGLRRLSDATRLTSLGHQVIVGLESCPSREFLSQLVDVVDPATVVFSLDLKAGVPLTCCDWGSSEPFQIAELVIAAGIRRMLVLDLAGVGVHGGVPNASLRSRLSAKYPEVEWLTGGGIRDLHDIRELEGMNTHGVLVASALHSGAITPEDVACWRGPH